MSLNNQIFSLRQAIIKAKRKAKNSESSQQNSSSQQSIEKKRENKLVSSIHSKQLLTSSKLRVKKNYSRQQSFDEPKIDTAAKDLYSSRKKRLLQSQNKSSQKKAHFSDTLNRSPLTYSNTFCPLNGQESRVSNFTVNSQISTKTKIHEKLVKLRQIISDKPSTTLELKNINILNYHDGDKRYKIQDQSFFRESMYKKSTQENQCSVPDYLVTYEDMKIASLFESFSKNKKSARKKGLNMMNKNQESIRDLISEWKSLKSNRDKSAQVQIY